jgi:hypothetical protein
MLLAPARSEQLVLAAEDRRDRVVGVSARRGATVRTVMCPGFAIGSIGTVSVTTMPAMSASLNRCSPSRESSA